MDLLGILGALGLLIWLAFRGWSVLLLAPCAALVAAAVAGEPLLAHWTQTFMGSASEFLAQFFPLFLLGALFGKLMEDSGRCCPSPWPAQWSPMEALACSWRFLCLPRWRKPCSAPPTFPDA